MITETCTAVTDLRRRREAGRRLAPMACGCPDPWTCRCHEGEPSDHRVDGYNAAIRYLASHGLTAAPLLPEMRALWRRGNEERQLVQTIAERWVVAS